MDLDSQPKPEPQLMSLVKQMIALRSNVPGPDSEIISLVTQIVSHMSNSTDPKPEQEPDLVIVSLIQQMLSYYDALQPTHSELTPLLGQIFDIVPLPLISLSPQLVIGCAQLVSSMSAE
ncbi:unnamed protein product [Arabidopsis thaliana]|uniref:(thale cress) hypothetical protein n=1 Tax=Arabidopsis thaliana TaxID=3702 RepID=A0A7G2EWU2_ARATH|nr:unnamed protein product [Arabidopsis thaliana]